LHHRDESALGMLAIQKIQIALRPALERDEKDPPAVRRCRDAEDVFLRPALAEDELVRPRIGAETMEAHAPVVVLVAGWDRSGRRRRGATASAPPPGVCGRCGHRSGAV